MNRFLFLLCLTTTFAANTRAQSPAFTLDDTLRGSITPQRAWFDLTYYDLRVQVNPADSSIAGSNAIHYRVLESYDVMQVDLQPPLVMEKVEQDGRSLDFEKKGANAYFVHLEKPQIKGALESVLVTYSGKPQVAKNAPWDGGFSWSTDDTGKPFVATSCQGLGASVWWPCKDHMYDEPDSQSISVRVPNGLMDVSNGRLRRIIEHNDGSRTFEWFVSNPINNYGINVNIADYAHFSDLFKGEKGDLTLDYYVLPANLEKAKKHFQQVKPMLLAFEHWFGPYPFYEDGYKLVEVPYLGMEHQSSVTYGNKYLNGYLGRDLSDTGWGLKWDFIIIHESGHEWFANNITYRDVADMWVHESFTNYSENLFVEYHYGKKAGAEYVIGCRNLIQNRRPIIGVYGVNREGSGDMYYKGGNMLHTIRQVVNDDKLWRDILRGLNQEFYHQTVDGAQVEAYMIEKSGKKLDKIFDQYLRDTRIPELEVKLEKGVFSYRWTNCVPGFDMPVQATITKDKFAWIKPTTEWQTMKCSLKKMEQFKVDEDFYVEVNKL